MLLAIAMVMVLFENERNAVQENALAFSTLGVDPRRLLSAGELVPSMQTFVERLVAPLPSRRAVIFISAAMARHRAFGAEGFLSGISGEAAKNAGG